MSQDNNKKKRYITIKFHKITTKTTYFQKLLTFKNSNLTEAARCKADSTLRWFIQFSRY